MANQIELFHAHIYYDHETRDIAALLRGQLLNLQMDRVYIGNLIDRNVGPHLAWMFEVNFAGEHLEFFIPWLMLQHGPLSVLIHPVSGNDVKDHFDHAMWLGRVLPLDATKL